MDVNEKIVGILSSLFNKPEADVKTALSAENGLQEMVTSWKNGVKIMPSKDYDTMLGNLKSEAKSELLQNLKPEDLPDKFRTSLVAWKLGELEKGFKEKYNFNDDFKGIEDLVDKLVNSKPNANNGSQEIQELKNQIDKLKTTHEDALARERNKTTSFVIDRTINDAIVGLNLDYEDDALTKQAKLLRDSFEKTYSVKPVKRGDKELLAVFRDGENDCLKDDKLDPIPVNSILKSFADDFGFKTKSPDTGGQGGSSSSSSNSSNFAGMSEEQMKQYIQSKGLVLHSKEGTELWQEYRSANKK